MSVALVLKQNDTYPPLEATLTDQSGAIDLTTATKVKFVMRLKGGATVVEGECTIVKAVEGTVRYQWAAEDTKTVGVWQVEFKITWEVGKIESVPNASYDEIEIQEAL